MYVLLKYYLLILHQQNGFSLLPASIDLLLIPGDDHDHEDHCFESGYVCHISPCNLAIKKIGFLYLMQVATHFGFQMMIMIIYGEW